MVSPCLLPFVTIATAIGNCLYGPCLRQIVYVKNYKKNVEKLRTMRADVQVRVDYARASGEVIKPQVEQWLTGARRIDEVNVNGTCFSRCCLSLKSRYKLGKKAKSLLRSGDFSAVSNPAPHTSIESIPTGDFVEFGSTKSAMNQVIDALKNEKINIVGVYGLGGVGKTTLMEQVGKQMKKEKLYNEVVMVTISQNVDLEKIQHEIAEKLGLKFQEAGLPVRAGRLCERLKLEERVLFILDDLWNGLKLHEIGIPLVTEHKGCKIVVTSRTRGVCNQMLSQVLIEVQVLSDNDSWALFKRNTGDFIESPEFHAVAINVVKECGGLPIAIVILGRALRGKKVHYWNDSLISLKRSTGMDEKLFSSLVISYNALKSEEMKLCFLFCCLFVEDYNISIEELMQYGIGEEIYKDVQTLEEARGKVRILVDDLKDSCLLLEGIREGTVRLHDVLRDLGIKISTEHEHKFLVKAGLGLKKWAESEGVDECHRISFVGNEISMVPGQPKCPKLQTLLLSRNRTLEEIPNNFFAGMKTLVVLDLSFTKISSLPSSSACLKNLRTLRLDTCYWLIDLTPIGGLEKLEILVLRNTTIEELPEGIGKLTNLKLLDLTYCTNLKIVLPNIISRLTLLQELYMNNSFSKWELEEKENGNGGNASINEVTSLPDLTVLNIRIKNTDVLSQDVSNSIAWRNLREFCIRVGHSNWGDQWDLNAPEDKRCMCLDVCGPIANWVKDFAERTEHLYLTVLPSSFKNVEPLFNRNPNCLKSLRIYRWEEREHVISVEEVSGNALGSLEILCIEKMNKLRKLCDSPIQSGFFGNLRQLSVEECGKLVTLLPTVLLQRLNNLERISVERCDELQEVFDYTEKGEDGDAILTKLTELNLVTLRSIKKIWKGHIPLGSLQSFKKLNLIGCHNLKYFLSLSQGLEIQQLESLHINYCKKMEGLMSREEEERGVMEGIASSHTTNSPKLPPPLLTFFQNLRELEIYSCKSFKYIFSWKLACGLKQLEKLNLSHCGKMEVIIAQAEEAGMMDSGVLPQLKTLELKRLPRLASFCEEVLLNMASLEVVTVRNCENLKRLPLGAQSAPNLKKIHAPKEWFEELEWGDDTFTKSRLQSLFIEDSKWVWQPPPMPPESDDDHEMGTREGESGGSQVESEIRPES